jgi:hypothetical protein
MAAIPRAVTAGRSYVVFGKTGSGAIDLSAIAAGTSAALSSTASAR